MLFSSFFVIVLIIFSGFSVTIKSISIFQSCQSDLVILHFLAFFEESFLIRLDLTLIEIDHLTFGLKVLNDSFMVRQYFLQSLVLFVFFFLGQHESAEFFELCFEIGCILLFLKITQVSMFHRRYYYN